MTALSNLSILNISNIEKFKKTLQYCIKLNVTNIVRDECTAMKNLKINNELKIQTLSIPDTSLKVIVIDNFLLDIAPVKIFAHNIAYLNPMFSDNTLFPGMRDKMPMPYTRLLKDFFETDIFPLISCDAQTQSTFHSSLLSLVTCKPSELNTNQKMPHVDSCNDNDYAFVHYLSPKELGGTSFYKYKPLNISEFTAKQRHLLPEMSQEVAKYSGEHKSYLTSTTSVFEQILTIEAKVNRLVIYPANILHSANLTSEQSYCGDLDKGRLSISSFASVNNK